MAQFPGAIKMLIPEGDLAGGDDQPRIHPVLIILHTNASNRTIEQIRAQYLNSNGEAHFQLETRTSPASGRLAQYVDTDIRADNNYRANSFVVGGELRGAISIETGDLGSPYTKNWTDLGQRQMLEDLLVWLCLTHNIPPIRATSWNGVGIGYHAMWGYNDRQSGNGTYGRFTAEDGTTGRLNNPWTNTYGKICPGPAPGVPGGKIGEFDELLSAVALRVLEGVDVTTQGEADMVAATVWTSQNPLIVEAREKAIVKAVDLWWNTVAKTPKIGNGQSPQFDEVPAPLALAFAKGLGFEATQMLDDGQSIYGNGTAQVSILAKPDPANPGKVVPAFATSDQAAQLLEAIRNVNVPASDIAEFVKLVKAGLANVLERTTGDIQQLPGQQSFSVAPE